MSTLNHKEVGKLFRHIFNTLKRNAQICTEFPPDSGYCERFAQRNAEIMDALTELAKEDMELKEWSHGRHFRPLDDGSKPIPQDTYTEGF